MGEVTVKPTSKPWQCLYGMSSLATLFDHSTLRDVELVLVDVRSRWTRTSTDLIVFESCTVIIGH